MQRLPSDAVVERLLARSGLSRNGSREPSLPPLSPTDLESANNPLRPGSFDEMVGQERMRSVLKRLIAAVKASGEPMDHILLVGASGTGKTTTAVVIARELGTRAFLLKAPVDMLTLERLRISARDGDAVFVDEIHMWTSGDRRGRTQAPEPESVFTLLEDGVLMTDHGRMPFPKVTWIGATTDVGLLPEPLVNRFPIHPALEPYSVEDMAEIARRNALALDLSLDQSVPAMIANASRRNPRLVNSYMRAAGKLATNRWVLSSTVHEVVCELNGTTLDGLDRSMQAMLRHLYLYGRKQTKDGIVYRASAGALATAAGHGRDVKAIYGKEMYLIESGLMSVEPNGRTLTTKGTVRAKELCK